MRVIGANFKAGINAFLLLIGALISHATGGGSFMSPMRLALESSLIFAILFTSRKRFLAGPQLALIVVLTQSAGHLILGQGSNSNVAMMSSHILGGYMAYIAVARSEAFWQKVADCSFSFSLELPTSISVPIFVRSFVAPLVPTVTRFELRVAPTLRRGPPISCSAR